MSLLTTSAHIERRTESAVLRAGKALPREVFEPIRRQLLLRYTKWDPQVGDVATLANFPLLLSRAGWSFLRRASEDLAAETLAIEEALCVCPDLHRRLGIERRLRRLLRNLATQKPTPAAARVMRFDFHLTGDGWRLSEINSDVPGGFTEASALPSLLCEHIADAEPAGDPATALVEALIDSAGKKGILLLSAAGFMEDQQVVAGLAERLRARGTDARLAQVQQLRWRDGQVGLHPDQNCGPIGTIVRFHQAEWLAGLRQDQWKPMFLGGRTPVCNPVQAILSESKRLPLVWVDLGLPVSSWRRFLPETREAGEIDWAREADQWVLKTAYCNTGDTVCAVDLMSPKAWRAARVAAKRHPRNWLAQRRFQILPVDTPLGRMYPCVGVYVVNGRACGIYGRLSFSPVIDYRAVDTAVLIERGAE